MKAIVQTAYGAPDDVLELREITPVVDSTFPPPRSLRPSATWKPDTLEARSPSRCEVPGASVGS